MKNKILSSLLIGLVASFAMAQSNIYIASHAETEDGAFNKGRVRPNATFDGTQLGQWINRGNAGIVGDGTIWHGFARYKMFERDLLAAITTAGQITWTTGLIQKEKNRAVDPVNGGHDVDVYLVLDPEGTVVPSGELPGYNTAWDWANELGLGYENMAYLGRIPQSEPMATEEEITNPDYAGLELDSPAMRITFDVTSPLKTWIDEGILTENSTIAVGLVQRGADIADDQGNPKFDDPNLYIHSQMVFEVGNAYLETSAGSPKGPGVFAEYDLVDGYVNTGDWMGWVYVGEYPWCVVTSLGKYVYISSPAGWVYVPK